MIGFDNQGQTKVWINENFGRNHPVNYKDHDSADLTTLRSANNEQRMVHNIINVVERKCEKGEFPEPFRQDVYKNTTFNDLSSFIYRAGVVAPQALEENRVNLNKQIEPIIQPPPVRQTLPPPSSYTSVNKSITNTRVSFNYVSPGMK